MKDYFPGAKNNFLERINRTTAKAYAPDVNTILEARCVITKVYDPETVEDEDVPEEIKNALLAAPGLLFCRVLIAGSSELVLSLEESADQIYSTYGNSVLLEGRPAKIKYRNYDLSSGVIVPIRNAAEVNKSGKTLTKSLDIGGLIGI